ncbi:hypothetical protein BKA93DRAFT_808335 [Sparassis latifolia]
MSLSLTRPEFDIACKAYISKYNFDSSLGATDARRYPNGWTWKEHASLPNFGYMCRAVFFPLTLTVQSGDEPDEDVYHDISDVDDNAALTQTQSTGVLSTRQYVVHSPTFQVPAFYFTIHDSAGSPLTLADIVTTPLFRRHALPETVSNSFAVSAPESLFPMLSQGDHPTLGTPAWYFHPCYTLESVAEVMMEVQQDEWTTEQRLLRWLETWFMVLGNIVDFGAGSL